MSNTTPNNHNNNNTNSKLLKTVKVSIRLANTSKIISKQPYFQTSIHIKSQMVTLWGLLGSYREYVTQNGIDYNLSPSLYALTYRALSDFTHFWIKKFLILKNEEEFNLNNLNNLNNTNTNSEEIPYKRKNTPLVGGSEFILNCLQKDILKNVLLSQEEILKKVQHNTLIQIDKLPKGESPPNISTPKIPGKIKKNFTAYKTTNKPSKTTNTIKTTKEEIPPFPMYSPRDYSILLSCIERGY